MPGTNDVLHITRTRCGVFMSFAVVYNFLHLVLSFCFTYAHTCPSSYCIASSKPSQPFDDAMYSEVRKGPRYVPKSRSQSTSPPPPPPSSSTTSPPPTKPPRIAPAGGDGLSELDNLLEMLNDTQRTIQSNQSKKNRVEKVLISE